MNVFISFPVDMIKYSDKSNSRETGFIVVHGSDYNPSRWENSDSWSWSHSLGSQDAERWRCLLAHPLHCMQFGIHYWGISGFHPQLKWVFHII